MFRVRLVSRLPIRSVVVGRAPVRVQPPREPLTPPREPRRPGLGILRAPERRRAFAGFPKIFGFPRLGRALARWFERRSGAPRDDARAFAAARKSMRVAARAAEERRAAGASGARRAAAFAAGARF